MIGDEYTEEEIIEMCKETRKELKFSDLKTKVECGHSYFVSLLVLDAWQEQTEKLLAIIHHDTNAITHADSLEAMRRILTGTATENLKSSDLKTEVECGPVMHDPTRADWYNYCPICGEKL